MPSFEAVEQTTMELLKRILVLPEHLVLVQGLSTWLKAADVLPIYVVDLIIRSYIWQGFYIWAYSEAVVQPDDTLSHRDITYRERREHCRPSLTKYSSFHERIVSCLSATGLVRSSLPTARCTARQKRQET